MEDFNLKTFLLTNSDAQPWLIEETVMNDLEASVDYLVECWLETGISDETLENFDHILAGVGLGVIDFEELKKRNYSLATAYEDVKDHLLLSCVVQKAEKRVMNGGNYDPDQI